MSYEDFLASKRLVVAPAGIESPPELSPKLFDFQRDVTRWALRRGRAALFLECGLGKGFCALEWARVVSEHTGLPVLILAPLAVSQQFVREGEKLGVHVTLCKTGLDVREGVNVTNYERLHGFDPSFFGGVVLDESSILKAYDGKTRNQLVEAFARTPFRLCCTATPAPNDHTELGNHAEFLGVMSRTEMLSMFFVHDGGKTQDWRLKGHARKDFWRWVASWAVALRSPADLGYDAAGYELPPLNVHEHVVDVDDQMARAAGQLFAYEAKTLSEQRAARRASLEARVAVAAEHVNAESDEPWLVWTDLNDESSAMAKAIPGAVEIRGSDSGEHKEQAILDFIDGKTRVIVSKPSITGWGVNLQHCARAVYVGLSHSFEAWHQSVRRIYRFGQSRPVDCHVVTSSSEGAVVANLKRKAADADEMAAGMIEHMRDAMRAELGATTRTVDEYEPTERMTIPDWVGTEAA